MERRGQGCAQGGEEGAGMRTRGGGGGREREETRQENTVGSQQVTGDVMVYLQFDWLH